MKSFATKLCRFLTSEDGPTAVEYAVMLRDYRRLHCSDWHDRLDREQRVLKCQFQPVGLPEQRD